MKYELAEPAIVDEYILGYDSLDPEAPKNAADRKEPEYEKQAKLAAARSQKKQRTLWGDAFVGCAATSSPLSPSAGYFL